MAKSKTTKPKASQAKGQPLKITLPGRIYQRGARWWWCTELPGEDKPRARALKAKGDRAATEDRKRAEEIALEMWEQAVWDMAQRQVKAEADQKVAKLKAQFLEKIRDFTQVIEQTKAKAQAEAQARMEAEAKLKELTAQPKPAEIAFEPQPVEIPTVPKSLEITPVSEPQDMTMNPVETATCECCNAADIPVPDLKQIDSGQLLCPNCLAALKMEVQAIDTPKPTGCRTE